jgi:hypothetical protein
VVNAPLYFSEMVGTSHDQIILPHHASRIRKVLAATAGPSSTTPVITKVVNAFGDSPTISPNTWVVIKETSLARGAHLARLGFCEQPHADGVGRCDRDCWREERVPVLRQRNAVECFDASRS